MSRLRVQLDYAVNDQSAPSERQFDRWTTILGDHVEQQGNIGIRIVSTVEMTQLNRQFRGKEGATNVLSFEADISDIPLQVVNENDDLRDFMGDIAICADVVLLESHAQNKPIEAHWAHLFVHGVLHLCGYDHVEDSDAKVMEDLETQILLAMGYMAPYRDNLNCDNSEITTRVS